MKLVVIGDTHGRDGWKKIVANHQDVDKIILIGDYFDTHDNISAATQIHNFKELLEFKRRNMEKVVLLIGNHDFHYLRGITEHYSGYQQIHAIDIQELIHQALDEKLLQMSYVYKMLLFTHAGVSKTWCRRVLGNDRIGGELLQNAINDMFTYQPMAFDFTPGENFSMYGDDKEQTPIWIRPNSLISDCLDEYLQVVGHTQQAQGVYYMRAYPESDRIEGALLIDTLGTTKQYVVITEQVIEEEGNTGLFEFKIENLK